MESFGKAENEQDRESSLDLLVLPGVLGHDRRRPEKKIDLIVRGEPGD